MRSKIDCYFLFVRPNILVLKRYYHKIFTSVVYYKYRATAYIIRVCCGNYLQNPLPTAAKYANAGYRQYSLTKVHRYVTADSITQDIYSNRARGLNNDEFRPVISVGGLIEIESRHVQIYCRMYYRMY